MEKISLIIFLLVFSFFGLTNHALSQDSFISGKEEFNKGNYQKAISLFRDALKKQKKNPELYFLLGKALYNIDSLDAAIIAFTQARELDNKNPAIYVSIGDVYAAQTITPAAIIEYQKAIDVNMGYVEAHLKLAKSYKKLKRWNDAAKEYLIAIQLDSTNTVFYDELGNIYFLAKQYLNASRMYQKLTELQPDSLQPHILYMKSLYEIRDFENTIKAANKVIIIDSNHVDAFRIKAFSLIELKNFKQAEETVLRLQQKIGLNAEDYYILGKAQYGQDKKELAIQSYENAVKLDSTLVDAYTDLGAMYMMLRRYEESAIAYEKKIALDSMSLSAYLNASASYVQLRNYEKSRVLLRRAVEIKPDYIGTRLRLAQTYAFMDSLESAKREYDEVLALIGDQSQKYRNELIEAYNMITTIYFQKQKYLNAIEWAKKGMAVGADDASIRLLLGQALILSRGDDPDENRKRMEEAVKHFRQAIEYNPKNAQAHLWLAQGLIFLRIEGEDELNKKLADEARKEYKIVLQLDPGNPDAKKGLERIGDK